MTRPNDEWLKQLASDGKGGPAAQLPAIVRGKVYGATINFAADFSADAFAASLRNSPDESGAALASFAVAIGAYAGGVTPVTLSLTAIQTAALPADSDADGLVWLVYDVLHTPSGSVAYRILGGEVPMSGAVT